MQNSQADTKKIFTKFFWRAGRLTNFLGEPRRELCPSDAIMVTIRNSKSLRLNHMDSGGIRINYVAELGHS